MLCYLDACVCTPVFVCVGGMVTDVHGCVVNVLVFEKGRIIDLRRVGTTDNMHSFEEVWRFVHPFRVSFPSFHCHLQIHNKMFENITLSTHNLCMSSASSVTEKYSFP